MYRDLLKFPMQEFRNPNHLEAIAEQLQPHQYQQWLWPQILAHYGRWDLQWHDGLVDIKQTMHKNIQTDWSVGLWRFVTQLKRSVVLKPQNRVEWAPYSQLVPIILAGVKQYQGIQYHRWPILDSEPLMILDPQLLHCLQYPHQVFTTGELLEIREEALQYKTGKNSGKRRDPKATWTVSHPLFKGWPKLLITMRLQLWVAHPELRHPTMILDPQNWDHQPKPLECGEPLPWSG